MHLGSKMLLSYAIVDFYIFYDGVVYWYANISPSYKKSV